MGVGIRPGMVYQGFVLGGELSGLSGYCLGYLAGMGLGTPPVASWGGSRVAPSPVMAPGETSAFWGVLPVGSLLLGIPMGAIHVS